MIYIGADHNGFYLKEEVKQYLNNKKIGFIDLGNTIYDKNDDYPKYAQLVALHVGSSKNKGILFCGSATGMVIAANKFSNIRAGCAWNDFTARQGKEHDDINVLVLPGRLISATLAKRLVHIWLNTSFSKKARYHRRVNMIKSFEKSLKA